MCHYRQSQKYHGKKNAQMCLWILFPWIQDTVLPGGRGRKSRIRSCLLLAEIPSYRTSVCPLSWVTRENLTCPFFFPMLSFQVFAGSLSMLSLRLWVFSLSFSEAPAASSALWLLVDHPAGCTSGAQMLRLSLFFSISHSSLLLRCTASLTSAFSLRLK